MNNGDFPLCKRLPEGQPPFSHGFPMVFPCFSHCFPMVFPWFSHVFPIVLGSPGNTWATTSLELRQSLALAILTAARDPSDSETKRCTVSFQTKHVNIHTYIYIYTFVYFVYCIFICIYGLYIYIYIHIMQLLKTIYMICLYAFVIVNGKATKLGI